MTKTPLTIYCLPVSGTAFTRQLAFLSLISKASKLIINDASNSISKPFKPDIALGSSGGNISAYIAYASNWDDHNISQIINMFDSETFLTSWDYYLIPNWIYLFIAKSLFSPGYGFESIFNKWFTGRSARDGVEIWTGTVDKKTHTHQLFTNKSEGNTKLTPRLIGVNATGPSLAESKEVVYMDGDIKAISDITRASASIPFLVNPVTFEGKKYSDGGGIYASPFSSFSENITSLSDTNILKLIFFASSNVDYNPTSSISVSHEIKDLINGILNQELRIFLNTLNSIGISDILNPIKYSKITPEELANVLLDLDSNGKNYGIVIYPDCETIELETDTVNFFRKINPEEIHLDIAKTINSTSLYVYT